ncbi:hypothetical protein TNCV_2657101 [Trichonephila clavipes]|nr:hypothetical protein TNCV_2657101 [Trichonephila clavipes]
MTDSTVLPVYVVNQNWTEQENYSQMRVGSVCHRILDITAYRPENRKRNYAVSCLVETILRQNKNTLIRALTEEWDKFQQLLDNIVQKSGIAIDAFALGLQLDLLVAKSGNGIWNLSPSLEMVYC